MPALDLNPGEAVLHEGDPERCVVLLPGVRYFSQAPLLWFARETAQAHGWSALELSERAPADQEPFEWMRDRARRALDACSDAGTVALIGKSLGSAAAPLAVERGLAAVWLTPLLVRPEVAEALAAARAPVLLVGSTADPTWADGQLPGSDAIEVLELDGLDHALQVEGDPPASLDVLRAVTERIGLFLDRLHGNRPA
ncbi:MAG: alpha/beta hydrolase [Thermoleophilaceae bacterium]